MVVLCTASAAMPACASSTIQDIGESKQCQTRAVIDAMPTLQAAARWRRARHAYGKWMMEKLGVIKRA